MKANAATGARVSYYDNAKGIGINLVVLAHSDAGTIIEERIDISHIIVQ